MSMTERREDMIELDACLARVPMPEQLEARIVAATTVRAVEPSPARRSLILGLAFASGVALTWLVLRDRSMEPEPDPVEVAIDTSAGPSDPDPLTVEPTPGLSLLSDACTWSKSDEVLRFEAGCRIRLAQPGMELEIWSPTRLRPLADGVAVDEGELMFVVDHVADPSRPARVNVSGGAIEVLGTRFAVHQAEHAGHVDLLDGAIQFRGHDGEIELIEPGQRYRWSAPAPHQPSPATELPTPRRPEPETPVQPPATSAESSLAEGLAEVARLRRAGDLDGAIAKLDALAREQSKHPRALESISYERGTLVERSSTPASACSYWSNHRHSFPRGRYDGAVERRLEQLGCATK
jgi:hypothetical protein